MNTQNFFLGLDIGASNVRIALQECDLHGNEVMVRKKNFVRLGTGKEEVDQNVCRFIGKTILENGYDPHKLRGIGISSAAIFDRNTGDVLTWPNDPAWNGFPLKAYLEEKYRVPVILEDDANAAALGEYHFGAGRYRKNFGYLTIGTGIGCGLILNGDLYLGTNGWAGELGHYQVVEDGPLCRCGARGCLQAVASGTALLERALLLNRERGNVHAIGRLEDVAMLAADHDPLALQVFGEAGKYLAKAIQDMNMILDLSVFILGGGVLRSSGILVQQIASFLGKDKMNLNRKIELIVSDLIDKNGVLGALALMRRM
jgi:glucokinase